MKNSDTPDISEAPAKNSDAAAADDAGYIRVGIRVRPLLQASERETDDDIAVDERDGTVAVKMAISGRTETFAFSSVHKTDDNAALFDAVGVPLCHSALRGYNGTLLAYGQTGSGKTFTMGEMARIGKAEEGLSHRMVRKMFSAIADDRGHAYELSVQYVQVYCEKIYVTPPEPRTLVYHRACSLTGHQRSRPCCERTCSERSQSTGVGRTAAAAATLARPASKPGAAALVPLARAIPRTCTRRRSRWPCERIRSLASSYRV